MAVDSSPAHPNKPPIPRDTSGSSSAESASSVDKVDIVDIVDKAATADKANKAKYSHGASGTPKRSHAKGTQGARTKTAPADSATGQAGEEASQGKGLFYQSTFFLFTAMPSWLTSMVIHIIAILILALITLPSQTPVTFKLTVGQSNEPTEELEEFVEQEMEPLNIEAVTSDDIVPEVDTEVIAEEPVLTTADDLDAAPLQLEFDPLGDESISKSDLLSRVGAVAGKGLEGRGAAARAALVRGGGGTKASEESVAAALRWFAAHQNEDGSWNLDHRFGPCQNRCGNHGTRSDAQNGATALALLPFLGAGQTHVEGEYQKTVSAGLEFLLRNMKTVGQRGSLYDAGGNYYSHGLGAIVLCEAYAMTKDKRLMKPAQMAIYETAFAQDPIGGGWRYRAQERGDTSALGWQLMALKSAHMAYLHVPPETYKGAAKFLDAVQSESGAKYGYLTREPAGGGTTAVGLLCRMYLGWKRDEPALERGVELLKSRGPSTGDMYYNYYGTQVMRHFGGDAWKVWNERMRDFLVNTQSKNGHEKGSWFFQGGSHAGAVGGRVYATSMATMILEDYYRHMPLYQQQAAEEDFPL